MKRILMFALLVPGCRMPQRAPIRVVLDWDGGSRGKMRARNPQGFADSDTIIPFGRWPGFIGPLDRFKNDVLAKVDGHIGKIIPVDHEKIFNGDAESEWPNATVVWICGNKVAPRMPIHEAIGYANLDFGNVHVDDEAFIFVRNFADSGQFLNRKEWTAALSVYIAHEIGHTMGFRHSDELGNRKADDGQWDIMRSFKGVKPWTVGSGARFSWEQPTYPASRRLFIHGGVEYDVLDPFGGSNSEISKASSFARVRDVNYVGCPIRR